QVAADIAISHRCLQVINALEKDFEQRQATENNLDQLLAIAKEANHLHCQLNIPEARQTLESLLWQSLGKLLHDGDPLTAEEDTRLITRLIEVSQQLKLGLSLDRSQELYYYYFHDRLVPNSLQSNSIDAACPWPMTQLKWLLLLGQVLKVDVSIWL
ncbi:MAG: glycoside hydrolase, partial [Microcystis sp. M53599_WE4]|nr:glycoside hydrolase [Microcystis sp. M53599_WE4]